MFAKEESKYPPEEDIDLKDTSLSHKRIDGFKGIIDSTLKVEIIQMDIT